MTNLNDTIDVLFERLNNPRAIFDEVATRTMDILVHSKRR